MGRVLTLGLLAVLASVSVTESMAQEIKVISGSYGLNCGTDKGNATEHLANSCDGRSRCDYNIKVRVIGDPARGCSKDYLAEWRCGSGSLRSVKAKAEAGHGSVITLSCEDRDAQEDNSGITPSEESSQSSSGDACRTIEKLKHAGDQGDAAAQLILGLMYSRGLAVVKNKATAIMWLNMAAENGNAEAKTELGRIAAIEEEIEPVAVSTERTGHPASGSIPSGTGMLDIQSTPTDSTFSLFSGYTFVFSDVAPFQTMNMRTGEYNICFEKDGYALFWRTVKVDEDTPPLKVTLRSTRSQGMAMSCIDANKQAEVQAKEVEISVPPAIEDDNGIMTIDREAKFFPVDKLKDGKKAKPPVKFNHYAHGKRQDCEDCHHTGDEVSCFKCHGPEGRGSQSDSYDMFHGDRGICLDCHKTNREAQKAKAPTKCKDCHKK